MWFECGSQNLLLNIFYEIVFLLLTRKLNNITGSGRAAFLGHHVMKVTGVEEFCCDGQHTVFAALQHQNKN